MAELERVYTIPLGSVFNSPRPTRARRAVKEIRAFLERHMKSDNVKLDASINQSVWARGIQKPPRKLKVVAKKDKEGKVVASIVGAQKKEEAKPAPKAEKPAPVEKAPEAEKPAEKAAEKPSEKSQKAEKPAEKPAKEAKKEKAPKKTEKKATKKKQK